MTAVERFLAAAAARPSHIAVHTAQQDWTYAEFADLVRRIAGCIAERGHTRVLIAVPQGPLAYAAMLGTLYAGAYYAPVNLAGAIERLALVVRAYQPELIIGDDAMLAKLAEYAGDAACVPVSQALTAPSLTAPRPAHRLAYVMFTSGSTGVPKGVMVPEVALSHYLDWLAASGAIAPEDRVSQHPNIAFDVSVIDTFGALCSGATLCPLTSRGDRMMPAQAVARMQLTIWVSTPSAVQLMARAGQMTQANLGSIRRFLFCGEALYSAHARDLFAACPRTEIWNLYGPTETTVSVTAFRLDRNSPPTGEDTVAIGAAIPGMAIWIEDGSDTDADEGELVIGGPQLAEGYWNAPEITARAFRPSLRQAGERAYYTGDWVQRIDRQIYFRTRTDHQIKIAGYRVELGEVAAVIRTHGWNDVVVVYVDQKIVAVVQDAAHPTLEWGGAELRQLLAQRIDRHALPAEFRVMGAFPRNANDKLDLAAIRQFAQTPAEPA